MHEIKHCYFKLKNTLHFYKRAQFQHFQCHRFLFASLPGYCIKQLGDPVLKTRCRHGPKDQIKSAEIQTILQDMSSTMQRYNLVGIAAPQIGVSLRIIAVECKKQGPRASVREEITFPRKVFINPTLRVTDPRVVFFVESCGSTNQPVEVPRSYGVEIAGLNENGEEVKWSVRGWPARILQHEVDHINGILNIDRQQRMTPLYLIKKLINWAKEI